MTAGLLARALWRSQPLRQPQNREFYHLSLQPQNCVRQPQPQPQPLQRKQIYQQARLRFHQQPQLQPHSHRPFNGQRRPQSTASEAAKPEPLKSEPIAEPNSTSSSSPASSPTALPNVAEHKPLPAPGVPKDDPIPIVNNVTPLPLWQRLGPLTWAADSFGRAQRRRPYVTQLCAALVIALCADLSVQRMNRGRAPYDPWRTLRSLVIGGISAIPGYNWFVFLARNFNYASRTLSIVTKVAINQIVFTPIFNTYFFGMQALLAGETPAEAWDRVKRTVPVSMVNSLKVWPAVTAFSFAFVPLEYRSIFSGVVAVGWQTYLMYLNRTAEDEEAAKLTAAGAGAGASGGAAVALAAPPAKPASVTTVPAAPAAPILESRPPPAPRP